MEIGPVCVSPLALDAMIRMFMRFLSLSGRKLEASVRMFAARPPYALAALSHSLSYNAAVRLRPSADHFPSADLGEVSFDHYFSSVTQMPPCDGKAIL